MKNSPKLDGPAGVILDNFGRLSITFPSGVAAVFPLDRAQLMALAEQSIKAHDRLDALGIENAGLDDIAAMAAPAEGTA